MINEANDLKNLIKHTLPKLKSAYHSHLIEIDKDDPQKILAPSK